MYLTCRKATVLVTVHRGLVVKGPPYVRRFLGQKLKVLQDHMKQQGGFKQHKAPDLADMKEACTWPVVTSIPLGKDWAFGGCLRYRQDAGVGELRGVVMARYDGFSWMVEQIEEAGPFVYQYQTLAKGVATSLDVAVQLVVATIRKEERKCSQ